MIKHWVEGGPPPGERVKCNDQITFVPRQQTFQTLKPGPAPYVGTFNFDARMTNTGNQLLSDIVAKVTVLTNGNKLLDPLAYPGSVVSGGGVGSTYTLPLVGGYSDGVLSPSQWADFPFRIGLMLNQKFDFFVDIECVKRPS